MGWPRSDYCAREGEDDNKTRVLEWLDMIVPGILDEVDEGYYR